MISLLRVARVFMGACRIVWVVTMVLLDACNSC